MQRTAQLERVTHIERAMRTLWANRTTVELRAFGKKKWEKWSGYYTDPAALARAAASLEGKATTIYFTLNDLNPEARFRSPDALRELPQDGRTTSDDEVTTRLFLPVDLDPARLADTPSSDEQHELALARARDLRAELAAEGWPEPAILDTGNGGALLYRIELPARDDGLVERCLKALDLRFSDDLVHVDTSVANPSRIWKVPFTLAGAKGASSKERPHRRSALLEAPETFTIVSRAQLEALAAVLPAEPSAQRRLATKSTFDLDAWIVEHLPDLSGPRSWQKGRKWTGRCPWSTAHTNRSFCVVQFDSGAIAARCHHNSCQGLGWSELRERFEPGYLERRASPPPRAGMDAPDEPEWLAQAINADPGLELPGSSSRDGATRHGKSYDADHGPMASAGRWEWTRLGVLEAVTAEPEPIPWLVDGVVAEGEAAVVTAHGGLGKTYFLMQLAIDAALGTLALGRYAVPRPLRVLWIDEEMGERMLRRRLSRLARGSQLAEAELKLLDEHLDIRPQQGLSLSDPEQFAAFDQTLREGKYDLVVMDSMVALSTGKENDGNDSRNFYNRCIAPYKGSLRTGFVLAAHPPKPTQNQPADAQKAPRGSGDRRNAYDRTFWIGKQSEEITADSHVLTVLVSADKQREGGSIHGHVIQIDGPKDQPVVVRSLGESGSKEAAETIGKVNACQREIMQRLNAQTPCRLYQPELIKEIEALEFDKKRVYYPALNGLERQGYIRIHRSIPGSGKNGRWIELVEGPGDD